MTERRTARILLVDRDGRLLLFRCWLDEDGEHRGHMWITPGGGMLACETIEQAAVRELREETGLSLSPAELGPVVARSSGEWGRKQRYTAVDSYFYVKVPAHNVDTGGLEADERLRLTAHHWWTLAEIGAATEPVYPLGLLPLMGRLLAGELPDPPVELPWPHHPTSPARDSVP